MPWQNPRRYICCFNHNITPLMIETVIELSHKIKNPER